MVLATAACQDSSYEAALQRRMDHQRSVWDQYVTSERKRSGNLHSLAETGKTLNQLYADRLKMSLEMIEQRRTGDWKHWDDFASTRQEQLRKLLKGQPEKIPKAWRDLTD